jgi:TnpA family transposase
VNGHVHVTEEELRASAALRVEQIALKGQSTRSFRFFQHGQCGMHGIGGIFNEDRSTTYACVKTTASLDNYGGYGGIAYHHVSDMYILLFNHFISCGVFEAIYALCELY